MYNVQTVTDEKEKQEAKRQLIEAAGAENQVRLQFDVSLPSDV
jgi:hypothetical protein